jgi:2,3-bisphosphoglycerate-independent phosphoglycerate mutase
MGEYLAATGVKQYAISETQKYGHVTYFFNGNRTGQFDKNTETYFEVPSDRVPFEQRPWMKAAEIADKVIEVIESGEYDFIRLNFANGDMVGHTGIYEAVLCAMEAVDLSLGRIQKAVEKAGGVMIVSADHGNSDDMYARDKKGNLKIKKNGKPEAKTSHSLNPVPCTVFDPENKGEYGEKLREGLGISSIAATVIELLGYQPPEDYDRSVLELGQ